MNRRDVYKRAESILVHDKMQPKSAEAIEKDVEQALAEYMKVSNMHVKFRHLRDGRYLVSIECIASNITVPIVID